MYLHSSTTTITIDDHKLCYTTVGHPKNPPLLMIHGWFSYRGIWEKTAQALSEKYYCVAIDLLGFGESDKPTTADYSIMAQSQRLVKLVNQLGWDKFGLLGHSMGGQIALCMASQLVPERITRLVDVAGVASGQLSRYLRYITMNQVRAGYYLPALYQTLPVMARLPLGLYWQYYTWFYKLSQIPTDLWAKDREMATQPTLATSGYKAGQAILACDLTPHLAKVQAPTLIIFGREDGAVPLSEAELTHRKIPNAQLVWLPQCGHFPMYEQPATFLQTVRIFHGLT